MANVKTGKLGNTGVDYAKVADRLKKFREENPHALVETKPTFTEAGDVFFTARILADKTSEGSAEATGTAYYTAAEIKKTKGFEKLETIAVGRALALLGYLNNGEVATTEEMEEFNEYKAQKTEDAITALNDASTLDELKDVFMNLGTLKADPKVVTAKDLKKIELQKALEKKK